MQRKGEEGPALFALLESGSGAEARPEELAPSDVALFVNRAPSLGDTAQPSSSLLLLLSLPLPLPVLLLLLLLLALSDGGFSTPSTSWSSSALLLHDVPIPPFLSCFTPILGVVSVPAVGEAAQQQLRHGASS